MLLLVSAVVLPLSGCWDRTEVNDIAIITAASMDKKEGQVEVSVQVFNPSSLGGGTGQGGSSGGDMRTIVRSGEGRNIADAVSRLQTKLPRNLFWGHCKVFIMSKSIAEEGIRDEMDFLLRHSQPRERAYMYVSNGRAASVLELLPPIERTSGEVIREISDLGIGMKVTLKDLNLMIKSGARSAILPLVDRLAPRQGEEQNRTIPYMTGAVVFRNDKMVGTISDLASRGVMWIRNEVERATITTEPEDDMSSISVYPVKQSTTLTPRIVDGQWSMQIGITMVGDLVMNGTPYNPMEPEVLNRMEQAVRVAVQRRVELALHQVQKEMQVDIFDFAERFHQQYPKQWSKVKDDWEEVFATLEVPVDISVTIRRPGMILSPAGLPENRVSPS